MKLDMLPNLVREQDWGAGREGPRDLRGHGPTLGGCLKGLNEGCGQRGQHIQRPWGGDMPGLGKEQHRCHVTRVKWVKVGGVEVMRSEGDGQKA